MILRQLKIANFRKFKSPGLVVEFHNGLNALVGENDAGKSAIIDAIKLVLQTQSGEYIRIVEDDFHTHEGVIADEFCIDCTFDEFDANEAKNFVEYLSYEKKADGSLAYSLQLHFKARRESESGRIYTDLRAGDIDDGIVMDGKAREMLKCVYLRPLRDAAKEMRSGRNSRISQILYNHPVFKDKDDNKLVSIFREANNQIDRFFSQDENGKVILQNLHNTLNDFSSHQDCVEADLKTSEMRLRPILESLSLLVSETQPGLGVSNLLFIAAELLLLNANDDGALRLALIEELEAHLHPQAQLRLIEYLQTSYDDSGVQIIISTHSPTLASKVNLKNVILVRDGAAYDLAPEKTLLEKGDYLFLQRFLDTTKANLFFSKALIMVEGDAENIVIPVIADILGHNLDKYGVSIVNVGGVAFLRYARIFCRAHEPMLNIRVAIVTDCDVKVTENKDGSLDSHEAETTGAIQKKLKYYDQGLIKPFVSPNWTFEYSLGLSELRGDLHKAILEAEKISNSDAYPLTRAKIDEIDTELSLDSKSRCEGHKFAYYLYQEKMLNGRVSKAIVAQCLAAELRKKIVDGPELVGDEMFDFDLFRQNVNPKKLQALQNTIMSDEKLKYIVNAIKYATGEGGQ